MMKKIKYSSYLTINFIPSKYLKPEKRERGARKVIYKRNKSKWKIFCYENIYENRNKQLSLPDINSCHAITTTYLTEIIKNKVFTIENWKVTHCLC